MNNEERKQLMTESRRILDKTGRLVGIVKYIPTPSETPETDVNTHEWHHGFESMEKSTLGGWVDADLSRKMEKERDKYAALLCEAMSYAYGWPDQGATVSALISAFEALELTPANGSC